MSNSQVFYELAILGKPSQNQISELEKCLSETLEPFGLTLNINVKWSVCPTSFAPSQLTSSAVVFYGAPGVSANSINSLLKSSIPILPIASKENQVHIEIPESLRSFNCLFYDKDGSQRIATALLECAGLLPKQRRVFISYRRTEAKEAALQLFDELSSKHFDVFLDTHGIAPAEDFQAMLWHRLSDSDVVVMLDTPGYFESRWTSAEFGRALSKGISVLRVGWPKVGVSRRAGLVHDFNLNESDIDNVSKLLSVQAIQSIWTHIELLRSKSHAVRNLNLFAKIKLSIELIGGEVTGMGLHRVISATLADSKKIVIFPIVGVPTSINLHDARLKINEDSVAVVYDEVGLHSNWLNHLDWLDDNVAVAGFIKSNEVGWKLAALGEK